MSNYLFIFLIAYYGWIYLYEIEKIPISKLQESLGELLLEHICFYQIIVVRFNIFMSCV